MDNITVLHIVTMFSRNDSDPGVVPWLLAYIKELQQNGVKNVVLAPSYKGLGNHSISGIEIIRFRYFPKRFENLTHEEHAPTRIRRKPLYLFELPSFFISGYIKVRKTLNELKPDIVHIHWPFPMVFIGSSAYGKFPVVLKFYSAEIALLKSLGIFKPIMGYYARRSTMIVANSSFTANLVRNEFGCNAEILYDGYFFPEIAPDVRFPEHPKKGILFVGRLVERKGVEYLLKAGKILKEKMEIEITIIGDGPLMGELKAIASGLGIQDRVRFLGKVSDDERNNAYRMSDVFVLPACHDKHGDTEGLGTVLLEALSAGKPIIGSNVGGIPDIIKHEQTGLLVPEKDPLALANAIERLLSDKELYLKLAKSGFEYAKENFSITAIAKRGKELYLKAIENFRGK